jgi:hypothetical protein
VKSGFVLKDDGTLKLFAGDAMLHSLSYEGTKKIYISVFAGSVKTNGAFPFGTIIFRNKKRSNNELHKRKGKLTIRMGEKMFSGTDIANMLRKTLKTAFRQKNINVNVDSKKKEIDKVLDLLNAGKITTKEATALIKALKK